MSMCPEIRNVADAGTDLTELELPETMKTDFPDPTDVLNFTLTITPDEGESFDPFRSSPPSH